VIEPLRITFATRDGALAAAFQSILAQEPDIEVAIETRGLDALAWSAGATPHVVVAAGVSGDVLEVFARLRGLPRFDRCRMVLARPALAPEDGAFEASQGVHEFLSLPFVPAEIVARVRTLGETHRMYVQLMEERARGDRMHSAFHDGYNQILRLLIRLVDLHFPGAEARGASVAALTLRIASRFKIPDRYMRDLDLAARLYEVGRMVLAADDEDEDDEGDELNRRHALNPGASALASRALLSEVEGMKGVAEVLASVYENWDGTGVPERFLQGQIPLRSRILRIAIDYLHALDRHPGAPEDVLERMEEHSGTYYDPLVLVHFRTILVEGGAPAALPTALHVAIEKLRVGMVLVEDLYTDNGLKLLSSGTSLSPTAIETIRRRHRVEPILRGAVVERDKAA